MIGKPLTFFSFFFLFSLDEDLIKYGWEEDVWYETAPKSFSLDQEADFLLFPGYDEAHAKHHFTLP